MMDSKGPVTTNRIRQMKAEGRKIAMLTGWDYSITRLMDAAGVDLILVGDSLGMAFQGQPNTLPVTLQQMLYHTEIVARAAQRAMVITDMPFMTYHLSAEQALRNAGKCIQKARAHGVKMEGGEERAETIARVVREGIPVMAHIGYRPQSTFQFGDHVVQGKDELAVQKLIADLEAVEQAGAFCVVLEAIRWEAAKLLTEKSRIPTIGIGSGPYCDGQIMITADILGLYTDHVPKFVKRYAQLADISKAAIEAYIKEVREGTFPDLDHSYGGGKK